MSDFRRQIAGNAGYLYCQVVSIAVGSLVAVRLVTEALGVTGYGVYAAVFSVASLAFYFGWSLQQVIQRFIGYEFGRGRDGDPATAFASGQALALLQMSVFLLSAVSGGLWYVREGLSLPEGTLFAAQISLLAGAVALSLRIVRLPYLALTLAAERMRFQAVMGLVEAGLMLVSASTALAAPSHRLETYSLATVAESLALLVAYRFFCRRKFPAVCRPWRGRLSLVRAEAVLYVHCLPSQVGNLLKYEGVNLLINFYAGVAYNASWSVAMKVGTGLYSLISGFQSAYFPRFMTLWSQSDRRGFREALQWTLWWSSLVMAVISMLLLLFAEEFLSLWLGPEQPPEAAIFVRCAAVHFLIDAMSGPLTTAVLATGRVLRYQILVSLIASIGFFLSWLLLANGLPAWISFAAVAATNLLALFYRLHYVRTVVNFVQRFKVAC